MWKNAALTDTLTRFRGPMPPATQGAGVIGLPPKPRLRASQGRWQAFHGQCWSFPAPRPDGLPLEAHGSSPVTSPIFPPQCGHSRPASLTTAWRGFLLASSTTKINIQTLNSGGATAAPFAAIKKPRRRLTCPAIFAGFSQSHDN